MLFNPLRDAGLQIGGGTSPTAAASPDPKVANTGNAPGTTPENGNGENGGEKRYTQAEHQAEVDRVVTERLKRAEEKAERDRLKAAKDAELAGLAEKQEFQQLAAKRQERILELEPVVSERDALAEENAGLKKALEGYRDQLLTNIPAETKALLLEQSLTKQMAWLNENAAKFGATPPPKVPFTPNAANPAMTAQERQNQPYFRTTF